MLRWSSLILLAGCDSVLGLEREGLDDDGDGAPDREDGCPHIPGQSAVDVDRDGISADCDIDDSVASAAGLYWTFLDGQLPPELVLVSGNATPDPDAEAIILGQRTDLGTHALVAEVITDAALIDIGFEVLDNAIEDDMLTPRWVELGLYIVHRGFSTDYKLRGDNCYVGRDPMPDTPYLELNQDEQGQGSPIFFAGPLTGLAGRMREKRTPVRMDCAVVRPSGIQTTNGFDVTVQNRTGKIAISVEGVRVRVTYVWISRP